MERFTKHINLSLVGTDPTSKILKGVVLASVGPAVGHSYKNMPLFADETTLVLWQQQLVANGNKSYVNLDHSENVGSRIGFIIGDSVKLSGSSLIGDIQLLDVAFTRSTKFIGEYLLDMAIEAPVLVGMSFEFDASAEIDHESKIAYIRPVATFGTSFVNDPALETQLTSFSKKYDQNTINTNIKSKDTIMAKKASTTKEPETKVEVGANAPIPAPEVKEVKLEAAPAEVPVAETADMAKATEPAPEAEKTPAEDADEDAEILAAVQALAAQVQQICDWMKGDTMSKLAEYMEYMSKSSVVPAKDGNVETPKAEATPAALEKVQSKLSEGKSEKKQVQVTLLADVEETPNDKASFKLDLSKVGDREYWAKHKDEIKREYNKIRSEESQKYRGL